MPAVTVRSGSSANDPTIDLPEHKLRDAHLPPGSRTGGREADRMIGMVWRGPRLQNVSKTGVEITGLQGAQTDLSRAALSPPGSTRSLGGAGSQGDRSRSKTVPRSSDVLAYAPLSARTS